MGPRTMVAGAMDQEPWLARCKSQVYTKSHISQEPKTQSQGPRAKEQPMHSKEIIFIDTTILHDGNQKFNIQNHSSSQSRLEAKVDYRTA